MAGYSPRGGRSPFISLAQVRKRAHAVTNGATPVASRKYQKPAFVLVSWAGIRAVEVNLGVQFCLGIFLDFCPTILLRCE